MHYLEWNNLIAQHFFNPDQAGKDIHLFITKQEIINLVKENFEEETDKEIWEEFLRKLRNGLPGSNSFPDIFDKALHSYQQWKRGIKSIEGIEIKYPPYVSYLVFSVLPLIEIQGDYNVNNYYDRLSDFLKENEISQNLRGKLRDIHDLWDDLSFWANETKNGSLGSFKAIVFSHTTWRFVGKPFSQCILTPRAIRKLPDFFFTSGLVPKTFYPDEVFRNHLLKYGFSILGLSTGVIDIIKKPDDDLGKSIIETVKSEFNEWSGEKHEIVLKDGVEKKIRKNTVVPIKLQFKIDEDGEINFSYRIKYSTEPPPELKFDGFEDIYENKIWSKTLKRPFKDFFELRDNNNKWIARFESRSIRLFLRGGYYQLSNDFWIETDSLSRVEEMYLLCSSEIEESIKTWIQNSCTSFHTIKVSTGLLKDYSLFRFRNPEFGHDQFQLLKVYQDKKILVREGTGLKISHLTYLNEQIPEIEISNADGNEIVYIQYENDSKITYLNKHPTLGGVWLLPDKIYLNSNFIIQIENEFLEAPRQLFKIVDSTFNDLTNDNLDKKNKYGEITEDLTNYIQGNKIQISNYKNSLADVVAFNSNLRKDISQSEIQFVDSLLLKWLVAKKECNIFQYNEAFDIVLHSTFSNEQNNVLQKRKYSIPLLDNLGFVDYDYTTGKLYTLPPRLISIPPHYGVKASLIGGRDENLINAIVDYCVKSTGKICISIKKHNQKTQELLMPDAIYLESNSKSELIQLANHFRIEFDDSYILKLKYFIPNLNEYDQYIRNAGTKESWENFGLEMKEFKKTSLKFEPIKRIDKTYSLTECKPSYISEYGLWIKNNYYKVDKNWGKYLFINELSEIKDYRNGVFIAQPREIYYNDNCVAIPASLPLPKYFSRIMIQTSGEPPELKYLNLNVKSVLYNIYRNIPPLFSQPFFQHVLNMKIEKTNQEI